MKIGISEYRNLGTESDPNRDTILQIASMKQFGYVISYLKVLKY